MGSDDGVHWGPLDAEHPVSHVGGAEGEFLPLGDGRVVVTVRKEGPIGGWGSDICVSEPGRPARWERRPRIRASSTRRCCSRAAAVRI